MADVSLEFEIHPSSGVPIYRQVMDQVRALVASGRVRPGDMLPSIRQLAADLEVNMMTISKAYARLEAEGILERVRGTGMRVTESVSRGTVAQRQEEIQAFVDALVTRAMQLNLTESQIISAIRTALKERHS